MRAKKFGYWGRITVFSRGEMCWNGNHFKKARGKKDAIIPEAGVENVHIP
jgi:hypothetical protein